MTGRSQKVIPKFSSDKEENAFWMRHDASDYFDLSKAKHVTMPNLKPTIMPMNCHSRGNEKNKSSA